MRGNFKAWGKAKVQALWTTAKAGASAAQVHTPLRFQGQYWDEETGLHYNRFRYYDPHCGRFVSRDPIGLAGGINIYQYAPNAVQWVDPLGLAGDHTLKPGPFSTEFIPARGAERDFTVEEKRKINVIGFRNGCRTCGSKEPGTKSGNYILDH